MPDDLPTVNRYGEFAWENIVAIIGNRIQFDESGPSFRSLEIYLDDGSSEDFTDASYVDGWLALVDAICANLDIESNELGERLTSFEAQPLWKRGHQHYKHLLIYKRDSELPDILTAECEFCGSSHDLIV